MLRTATEPLELGTWHPDQKETRNVVFFSEKKVLQKCHGYARRHWHVMDRKQSLPPCGNIFSVRGCWWNFSSQSKVSNFKNILCHKHILWKWNDCLLLIFHVKISSHQEILILNHEFINNTQNRKTYCLTRFQIPMEISICMHVSKSLKHLRHKVPYLFLWKRSLLLSHYLVQIAFLVGRIPETSNY